MPSSDPKPPGVPMTRRHIWLADDDWEWVCRTFEGKLSPSAAVRQIIAAARRRIEAKIADAARRPTLDAQDPPSAS